jgi:dextranase
VLPFDGLHVDQYGEPKVGFRASGEGVDLPGAFTAFIQALKSEHPDKTVVFNAVENWPIEALARSLQDFNYIEVWPPQTRYLDLVEIVANARNLSGRKPVVIALYLPADRLANIRLADALIYSSGGSRIELGETGRLLTDPYFPNHQPLPPEALEVLRRYADFAVRYGELIGPYAGSDPGVELNLPQGVWGAVRSSPGWRAVSLVNLRGLADPRWDEDHAAPHPQTGPVIRLKAPGEVRQVWWASADRGEVDLTPAAVQMEGKDLQIRLPYLDIWGMVALALDRELPRA